MPKFFIEAKQIQEDKITLFGEDVKHIANVLRKQIGDEIYKMWYNQKATVRSRTQDPNYHISRTTKGRKNGINNSKMH